MRPTKSRLGILRGALIDHLAMRLGWLHFMLFIGLRLDDLNPLKVDREKPNSGISQVFRWTHLAEYVYAVLCEYINSLCHQKYHNQLKFFVFAIVCR